ncbi:MAG: hypothetical protein IPP40_14155 [bacterium]|nr:hypothetical protein [bacterium]
MGFDNWSECGDDGGFGNNVRSVRRSEHASSIAASMMAIEMFGPKISPYAAGCAMVAFIATDTASYPSQVLSASKSDSLHPFESYP